MTTAWAGCYDDSWKWLIVDEAFAHPAKMARGLIVRIFDYLLERGYVAPGMTVVDPFGGIGTTAIEGASRGLRVVCCELELKFHALALRNFELHRRAWESTGDPLPVIVCGDSRRLRNVLHEAGMYGLRSNGSPDSWALLSGEKQLLRGSEASSRCQESGDMGIIAGERDRPSIVVSSPPYTRDALGHAGGEGPRTTNAAHSKPGTPNSQVYGDSPANLGNLKPGSVDAVCASTFWGAALDIVRECREVLKPGGIAAWVVKGFVRKGKLVDFPADWRRLCEACGFELIEEIHASLVKRWEEPSLFGKPTKKEKKRVSFFRRLHERKPGAVKIDHETVLVMRKPETNGGARRGRDCEFAAIR